MDPQNVFVVTRGEAYEGGRVEEVFKTLASARKYVENRLAQDFRPNRAWVEKSPDHWVRGVDMIDIDEYPLQD